MARHWSLTPTLWNGMRLDDSSFNTCDIAHCTSNSTVLEKDGTLALVLTKSWVVLQDPSHPAAAPRTVQACATNLGSSCSHITRLCDWVLTAWIFKHLFAQSGSLLTFSHFHFLFICFFLVFFRFRLDLFSYKPQKGTIWVSSATCIVALCRCTVAFSWLVRNTFSPGLATSVLTTVKQSCHSCGTGPTALRLFHLTLSMLSDPKKVTGVGLCWRLNRCVRLWEIAWVCCMWICTPLQSRSIGLNKTHFCPTDWDKLGKDSSFTSC